VPISFVDREAGESKMSSFIVIEALGLVTWWGLGRLVRAFGRQPPGAGTDITVPAAKSAGSAGSGDGIGSGPRSYSGAADPVRSP